MAVPRRSRAERRPLPPGFGTIWSTVALDLVGFGIILPLLPQYAERFGASPAVIGANFLALQKRQANEYMQRLTVAGLGERRERMDPNIRTLLDPVG